MIIAQEASTTLAKEGQKCLQKSGQLFTRSTPYFQPYFAHKLGNKIVFLLAGGLKIQYIYLMIRAYIYEKLDLHSQNKCRQEGSIQEFPFLLHPHPETTVYHLCDCIDYES